MGVLDLWLIFGTAAATAARRLVATPEQMVAVATLIGVVSVVAGLFGSLEWDLPAGSAIVLVAGAIFLASLLLPVRQDLRNAARPPYRPAGPAS